MILSMTGYGKAEKETPDSPKGHVKKRDTVLAYLSLAFWVLVILESSGVQVSYVHEIISILAELTGQAKPA